MRILAVAVLSLFTAGQNLSIAPSHVTVSTAVGAREAGKPIALVATVTPGPRIHVYAPGAQDYQPVALTIDPQPGLVVKQLHYPKSTLLVTELENVPVYDKPFRLAQDVTIDPKIGVKTMTVRGKLEYQACDDAVCYKPATIPVSWTVALKP